jgi:SNF2 family DNA or RNA helicase
VRNVDLRDYQLEGVKWLLYQWTAGRSCLLADEMGLGKTMQALAFIETLRVVAQRPGPFLVVVPLSTIRHWQKEFDERSGADAVVFYGTEMDRNTFVGAETTMHGKARLPHFDVLITTYETVQQEMAFMKSLRFTAMVVDEAHRLKNCATQIRERLQELHVDFVVLLTGTPIQNNVPELHSLLSFLGADETANKEAFLARYGTITTERQVAELQRAIAPLISLPLLSLTLPPRAPSPTCCRWRSYKACCASTCCGGRNATWS